MNPNLLSLYHSNLFQLFFKINLYNSFLCFKFDKHLKLKIMEFKGTKGKWFCSADIDTNYSQPVINIDSTSGFESFATVWSGLSISSQLDKTTKANALLISKAPEMLEMLKECMRALSSVQSPATPSILLYREVEQLIKEATEL